MRRKALVSLCALSFLFGALMLAVQSTSAVTSEVDQQHTAGTGSVSIYGGYGRFAQIFRPSKSKLDKVQIELANVPGGATLAVAIRHRYYTTWDEGNVVSVPAQAISNGWNTFDFTDIDVTLSELDTYGIWVTCNDTNTQWKYKGGPSVYDRGFAIWQSNDKVDWDYNFKTWGYDPVTEEGSVTPDGDSNPSDNTTGSGSETLSATTSTSVVKPTKLTAEYVNNEETNGVKLAWTASTTADIDGYKVFRSEKAETGFAKIGQTAKGTVDLIDENVTAGTTYYYLVRAYKGSSQSASSNTASVTIPVDVGLAKPANFRATEVTANSISLAWDANSEETLKGYKITLILDDEEIKSTIVDKSVLAHRFDGLDSATIYQIQLRAIDKDEKVSPKAVVFQATEAPATGTIPSTLNLILAGAFIILVGTLSFLVVERKKKTATKPSV
jgi:hypothetical protein